MTTITVRDEGGDSCTMIDFGTFRSSLFGRTVDMIREINTKLPEFEFRDDDVLLISYPKAGEVIPYVQFTKPLYKFKLRIKITI